MKNLYILLILAFTFSQPESDRCDPVSECASGCGTCCYDGGSATMYYSTGCDYWNGTFYLCQDESSCDSYNGTVTDIDGNVYETVLIGEQLWMAENLKVTHYNNGDEIPNITNNAEWDGLSTGAYGDYDNNPINSET